MFMGYASSQWIQLIEYFVVIFVLFTGTFAVSCIIYNKMLHKEKKNKIKVKKIEKKSYFIDVA